MTAFMIPSGMSYPDAIRHTVRQRFPDAAFEFKGSTELTTPQLIYSEPNPWRDAEDLASAIGYRLRYRNGKVTAYVPWRTRWMWWRFNHVTQPWRAFRRWVGKPWEPPEFEWPDPRWDD